MRVLLFALCFKPLKARYPSMFDGARALAEVEAAIAAWLLEEAEA